MQITWVAYNIIEQVGAGYVSNVASARYRLILPAQALTGMGHGIRLLQVGPDSRLDEVARKMDGELVVFLKLATPDAGVFDRMAKLTLGMLRAAREQGKRVVADISDDHFGHPHEGGYFRELVNEVDFIVASTPGMAGIIRAHTQRPVQTVSDPYEGARHGAKFEPPPRKAGGLLAQALRAVTSGGRSRPLRLLWFGHGSNFPTVFDVISQLHRLVDRWRVEVHLVTAPETKAAAFCEEFNRDYAPACSLRFSPWSLETTWRALEECDMVVIPSRLNDPAKAVKSPNRLIESLWAGRFVCANPVPSYQEFDRFAWLGDDIVSGIEWALEHPREVRRRIGAAQHHIAQHYSPEAIAKQWETAFVAARSAAAVPAGTEAVRPQENAPVRLNLGCGDKILPGYVNVDIAASRGNAKPDVVCDLRRLTPFADASADEILSVHVVEHFWRWEVADVLKEWARVLKPGGEMIIECPNLLSACEELMRNPQAASGPGVAGQRSMWVLYGDPAWKDPLMVHRWGYTPQSLAHVMSEAGLVNVRQEPAQFKLREPRDMRLVGEKPAHAEHAADARPTTAAQAPSKAASGSMPAYSRANPSPDYIELQELYCQMHEQGEVFLGLPAEKTFPGSSLAPQAARIKRLIDLTGARTILDYGSGKGKQYEPHTVKVGDSEWPSVAAYWNVDHIACYDPAYAPFSQLPEGKFDGVISTDVLEHCPEEDMAWIVEELFGFAKRFVFANVACYPATKCLPNGENAHRTIRPAEWWRDLFGGIAARHPDVAWEVWVDSRVGTPQGTRRIEERIGSREGTTGEAEGRKLKLHLGCGRSILPGWVNLDARPLPGVDVVFDLDDCRRTPLPFPDDSIDEILASHVIEHLSQPLAFMQELHRVARPGAKAVFRVPYGASDEAFEDPTHVRQYFVNSFGYFSQPYYWRADYGYRGDWLTEIVTLLVDTGRYDGKDAAHIMSEIRSLRNVVKEMVVELKAVKPIREPKAELQGGYRIEIKLA